MVKFQERTLKRHCKSDCFRYTKFLMEFPAKLNSKIEPHKMKNFDDIDITFQDKPTQEFLNIHLVRNKTQEEINNKKPR
jgi:hypothetical protein